MLVYIKKQECEILGRSFSHLGHNDFQNKRSFEIRYRYRADGSRTQGSNNSKKRYSNF